MDTSSHGPVSLIPCYLGQHASSVHGHVIAWPSVSRTLLHQPTHLPKSCFGSGGLDAVEALATTAQESNTTNAPALIQFTTVSSASDASFNRAADPRMMKMMRYMSPGLWEHNDEASKGNYKKLCTQSHNAKDDACPADRIYSVGFS